MDKVVKLPEQARVGQKSVIR